MCVRNRRGGGCERRERLRGRKCVCAGAERKSECMQVCVREVYMYEHGSMYARTQKIIEGIHACVFMYVYV